MATVLKSFASPAHDHGRCIKTALVKAERACAASGKRLTPLRRRVLELIWNSHLPVKAYELLSQLAQERAQAAPPTVYRALEFLQDQGLSLKSFKGSILELFKIFSDVFLIEKINHFLV